MKKEVISLRQAVCIICMFNVGTSLAVGVNTDVGQDSWEPLLLALAFVLPIMLIYGRIMKLYPEKDLFEILETLFGKLGGKIIIVLMTWYALHSGALVLRLFSEFISINTLPETPELPIMIAMLLVVLYMVKSGVETTGRWAVFMLPMIFFVLVLTAALSANKWDFSHFLPIFEHGLGEITSSSFALFVAPFTESVLFLGIACAIKKEDSPYKLFSYSILISAAILLTVIVRNILTLGPAMMKATYFPSYVSATLIDIGDFFARIEGSITMNFILGGIMKLTVCLFAASRGCARLFNIQDYRHILMPVGLLTLALCAVLYKSIMEMADFERVLKIYKIPFNILIPVAVWITAEFKTRRKRPAEPHEASS